MQEKLESFIADLHQRGVVGEEYSEYKLFSGGTISVVAKLWAADDQEDKPVYVIKANVPQVNKEEGRFLQRYQAIKLFPQLKDLAPDDSFLLYHFVPGEVGVKASEKAQMLQDLVDKVINHYQPYTDAKGFGWCDELMESWQEFLTYRVQRASQVLEDHLAAQDHELVLRLANLSHRVPAGQSAYLLHGDCGVHNFLMQDGRLNAVIDPTPVAGVPIYDLLYAYCSSPDELTVEVLQQAVTRMTNWSEPAPNALVEEVLIALYCRMGTSVRHHPEDLPSYLQSWAYWKSLYQGEGGIEE